MLFFILHNFHWNTCMCSSWKISEPHQKENCVFRSCLMAGSLCLPVRFIAVVCCFVSILSTKSVYWGWLGKAGWRERVQLCSLQDQEAVCCLMVCRVFCFLFFFFNYKTTNKPNLKFWNFHIIKRKRLLFDIMAPLTSINNADRVSSWSWSSLGAS